MLNRDYEITLDKARERELNAHLDREVDDENDHIDDDLFVKLLTHRLSSGETLLGEALGNDGGKIESIIVQLANPYLSRDDVPELLDEMRQKIADYFKGYKGA